MRFAHRVGVAVAVALVSMGAWGQPAPSARTEGGVITSARKAHDLLQKDADRAHPVHFRAQVAYFDPYIDKRHAALFVLDSSGGVFVSVPHDLHLSLRAGDLIDLEGVTKGGDFAPVVARPRIRVIGRSALPHTAIKATAIRLLSGSLDGQWVEISGVVHAVDIGEHNVTFDLATVQGPVSAVTLREPAVDYADLVDAVVQIHGSAAPVFNRKFQMVGVHVFFPTSHELTVLKSAPADPFSIAPEAISDLLGFSPSKDLLHRVRLSGAVTLAWPGRMLCIQENNDGLCMETSQHTALGDQQRVEAVGFPLLSQYKVTLDNAIFRVDRDTPSLPIRPRPVTADQALHGDCDSQLVQIEGQLIGQDRATGDLTLLLRSGRYVFPAILPSDAIGADTSPWKQGSALLLTGVCSVQIDPHLTNRGEGTIQSGSFQILLRSRADVAVLQVPSWWTQAHTLYVLLVVLGIVIAAVAWILVLRRRVDQQTRALRTSEERLRHMSCHDSLTGLPNRVLFNDRLETALKRTDRFGTTVGVLMLDVDRFKDVNDTLGHHAGDQLLCQVANRISGSIRKTDTVARFGGDEFVVLLTDLHTAQEAEAIASLIVSVVSAPMQLEAAEIHITVSIGICTYPYGGNDTETLLRHADAAMYAAKANGRNAFQVYAAAAEAAKS